MRRRTRLIRAVRCGPARSTLRYRSPQDPLVARPGAVADVLDGVPGPAGRDASPQSRSSRPGSKIGSSTSFSAARATRSLAVGMPRRRSFPLVLGARALAYGQRDEGPVLQVGAYSGQEPDHAACGRLDPRGGPAVDPGCSRPFVRPDPAPRHREERRIRHKVVQVIEHAARISRGPVVKLGLNTRLPAWPPPAGRATRPDPQRRRRCPRRDSPACLLPVSSPVLIGSLRSFPMWAAPAAPWEYYDRSVPPGPPGRTARPPITAGSSTARTGRDPSGSHVHFVPVLTGGTRLYPGGHHGARPHAPWSAPSDWMPPGAGACLSRQPGPHRIPVPHPPGSRRFRPSEASDTGSSCIPS